MKILLIAGHGAGDPGAAGNGYKEANLTRELVKLIASSLKAYNVAVDTYNTSRNAFYDVQNGKFSVGKYDYAFEVHFNAFDNPSAHGSEIYVTTREAGIGVEQGIMKKMSKYFVLRDNDSVFDGVKRTNFLVINTLKNMGISGALLETCFITNKNDMIVYQASKAAIANDIAAAIAAGFGLKKKATPKIKVGSKVKINRGAVFGGLSSTRGTKVGSYSLSRTHTVAAIQKNKGVEEAKLKEINSWVAVKYLKLA